MHSWPSRPHPAERLEKERIGARIREQAAGYERAARVARRRAGSRGVAPVRGSRRLDLAVLPSEREARRGSVPPTFTRSHARNVKPGSAPPPRSRVALDRFEVRVEDHDEPAMVRAQRGLDQRVVRLMVRVPDAGATSRASNKSLVAVAQRLRHLQTAVAGSVRPTQVCRQLRARVAVPARGEQHMVAVLVLRQLADHGDRVQ